MRFVVPLVIAVVATLGRSDATPAADLMNGEDLFARCGICHALAAGKHGQGPSLHGLFGSVSGTRMGFAYSNAMKRARIVWSDRTLDAFLKKPKAAVPGTKMIYGGLRRARDRADLIAYLKNALAGR